MKPYVVTLRHENGAVDHEVTASSEDTAIRMVLEFERVPDCGVVCVLPTDTYDSLREALWQDERSG